MTAFLDSCVVIDVLRDDKPQCRRRLEEAFEALGGVVISSVVLHELVYGALISTRPDTQLALVDRFVERARVEPWTAEDGIAAARLRADLKATGAPVGAVDSLIAGQALNRGWSVITNNIKDFIRIPGLTLVDWSDAAGAREFDPNNWTPHLRRPSKEDK